MTIQINWKPRFVYGVLLLLSILALEVGYYLERGLVLGSRTITNAALGHLITEIGIAGLIGFVLALTFERLSAKEFNDLAKKERDVLKTDLFLYIYGWGIPLKITEVINSQILRTTFIRKNMEAIYTLKIIDEPGSSVKYVLAQREFSYEVENLTERSCPFVFNAATDIAPTTLLDEEAKFISVKVEGCEEPFELNEIELRGKQIEKGHERYLHFAPLIRGKKTAKVSVESQTVKHLDGGRLYLILSNHTCDLVLRVKVPNKDLDVIATAYAGSDLKTGRGHYPDMGLYHWKIEEPILAYHGLYVAWTSKESKRISVIHEASNAHQSLPQVVQSVP
jgi:hypothetical protein